MRSFSKLAFAAALIVAASTAAWAQATKSLIVVEEPYARATPAGALSGIVYMTLDNKTGAADRLIGASSNVAMQVQIHEMSVVNGVMQMRQLANGLPVPAGESVALKPGGYHVMLIGLKKPLTAGETFPLTLTFEKAGNISVTVPIKAMGSMQNSQGDMGKMNGTQSNKPGSMEMK
ncbi:MAG: copper chaperone PCu(A)C [Xanthobacteraceae bacterium]